MHYRNLGNTGLRSSILGIGSSPFRNGTPDICAQLLEQAAELDINYYDTARSYKFGEETVAFLPNNVKEKFIITTKTGARGGKHCINDLQLSLRTMKRNWIDVWMTHLIETEHEYELCTAVGGFCDIAISAKQAGLIRATGASFHAPTKVILRAIREKAFDIVMFQFNLIGRETVFGSSIASYREELLPAAKENGVGVVVMKVLAGGELRHGAKNLDFVSNLESNRSVIGGAVRYSAMNPLIGTSVIGMRSTDELVENVFAVEGVNDQQISEFNSWTDQFDEINQSECTRCGECLDICPSGIEIPKVFRLYDQKRFYGMDGTAKYKYDLMDINASNCMHCKKCQDVCPENFDIGKSLSDAHKLLSFK